MRAGSGGERGVWNWQWSGGKQIPKSPEFDALPSKLEKWSQRLVRTSEQEEAFGGQPRGLAQKEGSLTVRFFG